MDIPIALILPYIGKAYQFAVARAKEITAADGKDDWKDIAVQILEEIGKSGLMGAAGDTEPADERIVAAANEFVAQCEAELDG